MYKKALLFILLISVFGLQPVLSEEIKDKESVANVAELFDFHEVIYPLWHEAWPNKDLKQLKELLPQIQAGVAEIQKAKLPGILREQKAKWEAGVKELVKISEEYKAATAKGELQPLLDAAEKLHAQYENLVRVLRPSSKELMAFHEVLYKLYHYYMPDFDYAKIKESTEQLSGKMDDLMKAPTPKKLAKIEEKYNTAKNDLKTSLDQLIKEVKAEQNKEIITKAIENMHTKYQVLQGLFE